MGVPQIVMIIIMAMSLTISMIKHGEPRGGFWG